ncbi:MAG: hypothetical protein ABIP94_04120 [Planctomycetota bacterium]
MHTCPECGNTDMQSRAIDGAPVYECGLCGARFGERHAMATLTAAEQARERGVDPAVWPLVRMLDRLPGLLVRAAADGGGAPVSLPFVELAVRSGEAIVQLENLAKSLQLVAGLLHHRWVLEVEFQQHLVFVLRPRLGGGTTAAAHARDARLDLEILAQQFESYCRLRWWRHAGSASSG